MPLTPKNRKEEWLEGLVQHETTLTPKNRPEAWMKEIIDASGGGGGGTGVLVATMDENGVLDKTWQEIHDAPFTVTYVDRYSLRAFGFVSYTNISNNLDRYDVCFTAVQDVGGTPTLLNTVLTTNSADGYPAASIG